MQASSKGLRHGFGSVRVVSRCSGNNKSHHARCVACNGSQRAQDLLGESVRSFHMAQVMR